MTYSDQKWNLSLTASEDQSFQNQTEVFPQYLFIYLFFTNELLLETNKLPPTVKSGTNCTLSYL